MVDWKEEEITTAAVNTGIVFHINVTVHTVSEQ